MTLNFLGTSTIVIALLFSAPPALSQVRDNVNCGSLENGYGPFDYSDISQEDYLQKLKKVESFHFTREVELLIRGKSTTKIYGDIDYTLRAWPNHHRALFSMSKFLRSKPADFADSHGIYTMRCYFDRALRIAPDDPVVWMIYGMHFHALEDYKNAKEKYEKSIELYADYVESHYNYGLLLVDMGLLSDAEKHAKIAIELGYPLKGLTNKINKARK